MYSKYNKRVVVLIDEYDKPVLDRLGDIKTAEANKDVLGWFYGILKSMDPYLRLTFITGVTKFTKASVFSELNNLSDITLSKKYSSVCGIGIEALDEYFGERINDLSEAGDFDNADGLRSEILAW